jgi:hypothetical protein
MLMFLQACEAWLGWVLEPYTQPIIFFTTYVMLSLWRGILEIMAIPVKTKLLSVKFELGPW